MKLLKAILKLFGVKFNEGPEVTPREDSKGQPVVEPIPSEPSASTGKRIMYLNADKKRYPKAIRFELDKTSSNEIIQPKYVILHHTVSRDLEKTVAFFKERDVSVHFVVGKDGKIVQMADCNRKCWHAGKSTWGKLSGLNSYSIGIEVVNMGPLKKKGDKFFDYYGVEYKGPVHARKGLGYEYWEAITPEAERAVLDLCAYIHDTWNIPVENYLGHYEIAPDRKNDPYGLFSSGAMPEFRKVLNKYF